ncbi:MAG: hypothetical protein HFI16_09535 [Lachnospiraceae bacterium]|nr:hypothetical protein [Lachnospiraceae bacterium]
MKTLIYDPRTEVVLVMERKNGMTVKEYLQQLQRLDVMIDQRIQEKAELQERLLGTGGVDYTRERVQTGSKGSAAYEAKVIRMIDLETKIDNLIDQYVDLKHRIIGEIQGMKKTDHIKLLYMKYVENKKLEQIADEMNYTYQYVREMHRAALKEFSHTYTNLQRSVL